MSKYIGFFLLLFSLNATSGDSTGKIQVITPQTHPLWNGVMIQMADGKIVDSACGNSTWALIKVESKLDQALVSIALTAKTTQELVRVFTTECGQPPTYAGTIPIVSAIDLGIRQ